MRHADSVELVNALLDATPALEQPALVAALGHGATYDRLTGDRGLALREEGAAMLIEKPGVAPSIWETMLQPENEVLLTELVEQQPRLQKELISPRTLIHLCSPAMASLAIRYAAGCEPMTVDEDGGPGPSTNEGDPAC